jgi:hypothetical protein
VVSCVFSAVVEIMLELWVSLVVIEFVIERERMECFLLIGMLCVIGSFLGMKFIFMDVYGCVYQKNTPTILNTLNGNITQLTMSHKN